MHKKKQEITKHIYNHKLKTNDIILRIYELNSVFKISKMRIDSNLSESVEFFE